jgi:hypothetical protein
MIPFHFAVLREQVGLAEPVEVRDGDTVADAGLFELVYESNIEHKFAHSRSPLRQEVLSGQEVASPAGSMEDSISP